MNLEWRDPNTGQIKVWVWVVAGVVALVGIILLMRTSSTTSAGTVSGGQSSDMTDQLSQLQEALDALSSQSEPTPNPDPAPPLDRFRTNDPNYKPPTLGIPGQWIWNSEVLRWIWTRGRGGNPNPNPSPNPDPAPSPGNGHSGGHTGHGLSYTVGKGDTPSKIADKFGVSVKDIVSANKGAHPNITRNNIKAGWKLTIPLPPDAHVAGTGTSNVKA